MCLFTTRNYLIFQYFMGCLSSIISIHEKTTIADDDFDKI